MPHEEANTSRQGITQFRPRARLIHTMGDDLISNESVAILELVKNAYDADARNVLIEFSPPLRQGEGMITIYDNGYGMTLDTLLTDWMQPATSSKLRQKRSPRGRRLLGEKGIGRFSVSFLADHLELITRAAGTEKEVYALFDWTEFDRREFMDEVTFLWEERPPASIYPGGAIERVWPEGSSDEEKKQGTILCLSKLRANWDHAALNRLRTSLTRLVSPRIQSLDFSVTLSLPPEYGKLSGPIEPPASLGHPDYLIRGHVDEDCSYQLTYEHMGQTTSIFSRTALKPDGRRAACGSFDLDIRVWDRDPPLLEKLAFRLGSTLRDLQQDLNEATGISIYRDGFRVLPYGEPHNDWMRLDIRRVQNPTERVSNNQVVGSILITADRNPALQDQTNREGLKQGQAFQDLTDLILAVMVELEKRRYAYKQSEKVSGLRTQDSQRGAKGQDLFANIDLKPLRTLVQERYAEDQELQLAIEKQDVLLTRRLEQVRDIFARYSRLATLGQLVDVVLHDGLTYITQMGNEADLGRRNSIKLEQHLPGVSKLTSRFEKIGQYTHSLSQLFKRIEPFSGRARGRFEHIAIERIIENAINIFSRDIEQLGVKVEQMHTSTELRIVPGEVQQIFINLVQNSLYWLQQVPPGSRSISTQVQRISPVEVEVIFSDSGPGVSEEFRDLIFQPYFSGKPNGTGLGLTIAGETAAEYDGHLELISPGLLPGASFRLTLRQRSS